MAEEELVGKVIHYYDQIMVAVVALGKALRVGDTIRLAGKDAAFTQAVSSMQLEHKPVEEAKKGAEVAIKVDQPVKRGWQIFKPS